MATSKVLLFVVLACVVIPFNVQADPLAMGNLDSSAEESQYNAQQLIDELGIDISVGNGDIVKIGSGYTVAEDETIYGDIVIIGGGLTINGRVNGSAVVIGGSMYLASTSVIEGDAVVIGGILQQEPGSIVKGDLVENPQGLAPTDEAISEQKYESISKDIVKFGKDIHVAEGEVVEGDVVAIGGDIRIDGKVTGDVVATAGDITLGPTAEVLGDVVATFGEVTAEAGAKTEGEIIEIDMGGAKTLQSHEAGIYREGMTYVISLYAPEANDVRLTGDWLDWDRDGIKMERNEEGVWKTTVTLAPGSYQYKFIVDGTEMPDPDVEEKVPDGKGGYATPLVVKSRRPSTETELVKIIFSLDRPEAEDVRVTGSWNNWDEDGIKMTKSGTGVWSVTVPLEPGYYTYKFYIDGKWVPDPDVDARVADGRGGWATPLAAYSRKSEYVPVRFTLDRPEAEDIRVTGSWNNWDPEGIRMAKDEDGLWSITIPLKPGTHFYKFYIDGKWVADPDEPDKMVSDGKGGYMTKFVLHPRKKRKTFTVRTTEEERPGLSGALDYNRVDGLYLGLKLSDSRNYFPMPRFRLEGGYSYKRKRWLYSFEVEQPLVPPFRLSIGGSIYDKTESNDRELISDFENLLVASFLKQDYMDYFDLRGATAFVALHPWKQHTLKLAYSEDEYRPLETRAHTSLFFRKNKCFRPNPRNSVQICTDRETGMRVCSKIDIHSLLFSYELDTRREPTKTPTKGTWLRLSSEWARREWGSDYSYERYAGDLRHYFKISPDQQISLRLKAGMLDVTSHCASCCVDGVCRTEPQFFFPKQFAVGGIGTLPGYGYKQFQGTHMVLSNFEYVYSLGDQKGIVFFSDAGDAVGAVPRDQWDADDIWRSLKLKVDVGVAFRHEDPGEHSFTLGVAKGLTKLYDKDERPVIVLVRASRMF